MSKVLDADYVTGMLDQIDSEGWDAPAGRELLDTVRRRVIRPIITSYRLTDATADQAESTAWAEAWRALCRPSIRTHDNPGLLLVVAVRRCIQAELNARNLATSPDKAWRLYDAARTAGQEPPGLDSLQVALDGGLQLPAYGLDPSGIGPLLEGIADALAAAGWETSAARDLVEAIAISATPVRGVPTAPWRQIARQQNLPQWQVRRICTLLLGDAARPGLVAQTVRHGLESIDPDALQDAISATLNKWLPAGTTRLAHERAQTGIDGAGKRDRPSSSDLAKTA